MSAHYDERRAARQTRSRPLLDAMHARLHDMLHTLSQKSAMAKAIRYALSRWAALLLYCDDGRVVGSAKLNGHNPEAFLSRRS